MRALAAGLALLPSAGFACALPPSVILTLPTGHYILGAAVTVGLTAALGAMAQKLPAMQAHLVYERQVWVPVSVTSYISFLCLLGLILIGFYGSRDPMHNLITLVFWTGVWIALPLASMVFGNLWYALNPWTAPVRIARTLLGRTRAAGLGRFGNWPAVAGYAAFGWFQIVSLYPDDPAVLAQAALIYWLIIFVLAVAEGEDWLQKGEFLTVFFGYIAKIAPVWFDQDSQRTRLFVGAPGAQVLRMAALTPSAIAFVTLALAVLTFDGLSETFWWLALIGQNPLEFTGRSAVVWVNSAGLVSVWALTAVLILGALKVSNWIGGVGFSAGPVMLSFLAIAAGYHAAHHLVTLLTTGQYTLAALDDPLFRGDSLLGLPFVYVSFGFLTDGTSMSMIYAAQFAAILGAHVLAVVLTLKLASRNGAVLVSAHLPMTALMIAYTVLGLWLLSTARGA
jgi:hypothetical protein